VRTVEPRSDHLAADAWRYEHAASKGTTWVTVTTVEWYSPVK